MSTFSQAVSRYRSAAGDEFRRPRKSQSYLLADGYHLVSPQGRELAVVDNDQVYFGPTLEIRENIKQGVIR